MTMRHPLFTADECRKVLLEMAQQQSAEEALRSLVTGLAARCGAALARVWLVIPKSRCTQCLHPERCVSRSECLQLTASAGRSLDGSDWSSTTGNFAHIPYGLGKVGYIAETRSPVEERRINSRSRWIANPEWAREEQIQGLIGQPLLHRNQLWGVLAVFTRQSPTDDDLAWLRAFADHAAISVANGRAFAEVEQLRQQLEIENEYLRDEVRAAQANGEIVGEGPAAQNLLRRIQLVAPTEATVLIQGESGTGKELVARAIHEQSHRAKKPMITVNCAAIPHDLFESEFFGHVRGAFSGATHDRAGRFRLADGGTLLLDEVGEIPLAMQGKLLRALEQGTFERVGDERTERVDVRVVAATNRTLVDEVSRGRFRKDLFYRLSVFPIDVPPLRDRPEDISLLAKHFVTHYRRKYRLREIRLTRDQLEQLRSYSWPGNVRELRNVIERAVITLSSNDASQGLDFDYLSRAAPSPVPPAAVRDVPSTALLTEKELRQRERDNLIGVLKQARWKVSGQGGAAEFLGINPGTLTSRIRALGISRSQEREIE